MSDSNKRAKEALIKIYGNECMFERAKIAQKIEQIGGIKTYSSYLAGKRFKGKNIKKQLTYHHLRHKSDGGPATLENGAIVEATAHAYLHSLPRPQEEMINNMLRAYKINASQFNTKEVVSYSEIECDMSEYVTIPLYDNTVENNKKREINKRKHLEHISRTQTKRETEQAIKDYYNER